MEGGDLESKEQEGKSILTIIFFFKLIWNFRKIFKCINRRSKKTSRSS